jgi:hypothetical protein
MSDHSMLVYRMPIIKRTQKQKFPLFLDIEIWMVFIQNQLLTFVVIFFTNFYPLKQDPGCIQWFSLSESIVNFSRIFKELLSFNLFSDKIMIQMSRIHLYFFHPRINFFQIIYGFCIVITPEGRITPQVFTTKFKFPFTEDNWAPNWDEIRFKFGLRARHTTGLNQINLIRADKRRRRHHERQSVFSIDTNEKIDLQIPTGVYRVEFPRNVLWSFWKIWIQIYSMN